MRITDAILISLGRLRRMTAADIAAAINSRPEFEPLRKKWRTVDANQVYAAMSSLRSKRDVTRNLIEPIAGQVGKGNAYQLTGYGEKRLRQLRGEPRFEDAAIKQPTSFEKFGAHWPGAAAFKYHQLVQKKGRSSWRGRVVGWYSTDLTPLGYAVESVLESGSVQIYPETALTIWDGTVRVAERLTTEGLEKDA